MTDFLVDTAADAIPIWALRKSEFATWMANQPAARQRWIERNGFEAEGGKHLVLPGSDGSPEGVLLGLAEEPNLWSFGALPTALPAGRYRLANVSAARLATEAALGWALGCYRFDRYRGKPGAKPSELVWPDGADRGHVTRTAAATRLVRDLVNTPAQDMGPDELAQVAEQVAVTCGARFRALAGEQLLTENYPMVHAVGRASSRAPRLIDFTWGAADARKVTLVGKGVCFDSGGLDIKPASGMALMKKDMGGAATVLGLAQMIMQAGLNLRLRVLIPAVENAVGGNAFRPGDVLKSRAGISVEIGNTDAEGRLILADALAEADGEVPDLLIDFATLTGAARDAVGPDLPAFYCDDEAFVSDLARHAKIASDPHWRLPLHQPYRSMIDSKIADINNAGEGGFAGSITAALFLKEFVRRSPVWAHFDVYAWNQSARPGRPAGGEAMGMRALYNLIAERFPAHG